MTRPSKVRVVNRSSSTSQRVKTIDMTFALFKDRSRQMSAGGLQSGHAVRHKSTGFKLPLHTVLGIHARLSENKQVVHIDRFAVQSRNFGNLGDLTFATG